MRDTRYIRDLLLNCQGHSAGGVSVSYAITRGNSNVVPPFRAGIMLSGVQVPTTPILNFSNFDGFATAMGCLLLPYVIIQMGPTVACLPQGLTSSCSILLAERY